MASASTRVSGMVSDYTHLRTLPALLSVVFVVSSLYQFGGLAEVSLLWGIDYTLTAEHATIVSLATFAVAFASSETKQFAYYEDWEKVIIAAAPVLIVAYQYVGVVQDQFAANSPTLHIVAFLLTVVSWGVAVR